MSTRILVVGGVAGGMSCAARIKRLDDTAEVVVFEKGADVSFANCGMPYYIGGVIDNRRNLLVQTPESLHARYDLDVRVQHEAVRIDREKQELEVKNLQTGELLRERYDYLVLSTGAAPFRPSIPGADGPNVFVLNDLSDMDRIRESTDKAKSACVIGAGFIGLELVENLRLRKLEVHLVELLDQVMPPFDWEMAQPLQQELALNRVQLHLAETAEAIEADGVRLKSGAKIPCDFVCLCVGVRPTSQLAKDAGLKLGERGHIHVNAQMETSDPRIYAVGDVVEVRDYLTGDLTAVPLAGPANRQGRIAADNICGRTTSYRDTQGTAIVKVFGTAAALTGMSEKHLKRVGLEYRRVYLHPTQRPRYYPGSQPVALKLLFSPEGKIYGAQVVGSEGVEVMVDVIATAMRGNLSVQDLEHLELAYSPQWGNAKHGINMAGFLASNLLRGDVEMIEPDAEELGEVFMLDCRTPEEAEGGTVPGAAIIPLDALRERYTELPTDKTIGIYCAVGLRGYIGYRFLKQKGYNVRNLNGGYRTWRWYHAPVKASLAGAAVQMAAVGTGGSTLEDLDDVPVMEEVGETVVLDACGLQCPGPLLKIRETMETLTDGQVLKVKATDPGFPGDIPVWCERTGNRLLDVQPDNGHYVARIAKGGLQPAPAAASSTASAKPKKTIICFSGDLDKTLATFIIANGAAGMGNEVTIFFTFWGLNVLRRDDSPAVQKSFLERMFGWMMPKGAKRLKLSKMNMAGMGTEMMKFVMSQKNVMTLPQLIESARKNGVRLVACSMTMEIMGIKREELIDGVEIAGVANYLGEADNANVNLFI